MANPKLDYLIQNEVSSNQRNLPIMAGIEPSPIKPSKATNPDDGLRRQHKKARRYFKKALKIHKKKPSIPKTIAVLTTAAELQKLTDDKTDEVLAEVQDTFTDIADKRQNKFCKIPSSSNLKQL